jgi:hypothetical protein
MIFVLNGSHPNCDRDAVSVLMAEIDISFDNATILERGG